MRTLAILGATGSIGRQALDIARRVPDQFKVTLLTAHSRAEALFELVREFRPAVAALTVEPDELPEDVRFCQWYFGEDAVRRAVLAAGADDVLSAVVGIAGLPAAMAALEVSERLLLANKESLVTGGALVMGRAAALNKPIVPVDSEHSAIFQCLQAQGDNPVSRLILTASGGPFRTWEKGDIERATRAQALGHPTWKMGAKITVDCAGMMNKGFEVIEAHHLFNMPLEKIDVIVHPQSVIHSMVEFEDGAVLAQLGAPDMRVPIGYAMGYPSRIPFGGERLDFARIASLTFEAPDMARRHARAAQRRERGSRRGVSGRAHFVRRYRANGGDGDGAHAERARAGNRRRLRDRQTRAGYGAGCAEGAGLARASKHIERYGKEFFCVALI